MVWNQGVNTDEILLSISVGMLTFHPVRRLKEMKTNKLFYTQDKSVESFGGGSSQLEPPQDRSGS